MFGTVGMGSASDKAMVEKSEIPEVQTLAFPASPRPRTQGFGSRNLVVFPVAFPPVWETTSSQPTGRYGKASCPSRPRRLLSIPSDRHQLSLTHVALRLLNKSGVSVGLLSPLVFDAPPPPRVRQHDCWLCTMGEKPQHESET